MRKLILCLLFSGLGFSGFAQTPAASEKEKIASLIAVIEKLEGAKFIRNGTEYDGKAAAEHLRLKWSKAGSKVKTAEDFIDRCAAKSSMSGKPYQIRFADGTVKEAGEFLREKLKALK